MSPFLRSLAALTLAASGAAACTSESADARTTPATDHANGSPRELAITANEYAFLAPDTVPAGLTRVRLTNPGKEMHHMQIVRVAEGRTLKDLLQAIAAGSLAIPWSTPVGGPSVVLPGRSIEATLELQPGTYALLCFMPVGHLAKGMSRVLVVTPSSEPAAPMSQWPMPRADATLELSDYAFTLSAPLRAGRQTVRVENSAAQWHEVLVVRLAPGAKPEDVFDWLRGPEGPPPFEPAGGTMALAKGKVNLITLDLTPGNYALLCFVPDVRDRKAHVEHGMIEGFEVK
jgi:uncharacterized cupredoxin-like copper-binding protein